MAGPLAALLPGGAAAALVALWLLPKAALILGAAWLIERLCRRASAAVRHGIWAAALLSVVSLPVGTALLPGLTLDLPSLRVPGEEAPPPPAAAVSRPAPPARPTPAGWAVPARQGPGPVAAAPPAAPARGGAPTRWLAALLLAWASGAVLRLLWLGAQFARVRRLRGSARPETDGPPVQLVEELSRELGIRRCVRVLESPVVSMPLTWGMLRPTILLPEEAGEWPAGRLRVVVLHELAHIRRWDYLAYLLAELACALYWPVPLVWLARRRVQVEQERACDDLVLASGTASLEYAEHLLAVARAFYGNRWELGATVSMAREVSLKDRIRAILDDRTRRGPLLSGSGLLVLLSLLAFALPVAALRPDGARAEPPGAPPGPGDGGEGEGPVPVGSAAPPPAAEAVAPLFLWLEAEQGVVREPMEIREDLDAASGAYVVVPDAGGNDAPEGGPGQVSLSFELPRAGEYLVWGRVIGDHGNDNSLYVSVDGRREVRWDIEQGDGGRVREWSWLPVRERTAERVRGEPLRFRLAAGTHTLRVRNREDGTRLDRLLITAAPDYVPSGRGADADGVRPTYRWMGVEQAQLEGAVVGGADERTSSGRYISFERGRGTEGSGTADFVFDVEAPGRYVVWGRVLAPDAGANSFYVSLDGGAEVIWDAPERDPGRRAGRWSWSALSAREYNGRRVDPLLLDLQPGRHVLRLRTREAGTRLDGILVTNDVALRPRGVWPAALPARPARIWLEAESARLEAPLLVRGDSAAAGGLYVEAERRSTRWEEPAATAAGAAVLRFTARQAGLYSIWARTRARHGGEDSFWVRVNGGAWIRWNAIPKSGSWRWSMVHDADQEREVAQFQLRPGENTIEIAPREGGARLDRMLVTNDPLFAPDR